MKNICITAVPDEYKKPVDIEHRGTITEISYGVRNYINSSRQFVTNQNINCKDAGREIVDGEAIIKKCNVYLPANYYKNDSDSKYNVLYLLHGVGGNRYEWLYGSGIVNENFVICNIFDHLIANGEIEPLIVVFPEGRSSYDWTDCSFNSMGTNMLGFYYFDYELRYDLIPFIENKFNTYANIKNTSFEGIKYNRMHRAIAGLSMGGMQSLNLTLGGYRCDSTVYTQTISWWRNGLDITVLAPGMIDLFGYVGAFSNAPTSSNGTILGAGIASSIYRLDLLYITCGTSDQIAYKNGFLKSINGLLEVSNNNINNYYQILIKDGLHDFNVWNNGVYNFIRLSFKKWEENSEPNIVTMMLDTY